MERFVCAKCGNERFMKISGTTCELRVVYQYEKGHPFMDEANEGKGASKMYVCTACGSALRRIVKGEDK